jgi:hypothetical protein
MYLGIKLYFLAKTKFNTIPELVRLVQYIHRSLVLISVRGRVDPRAVMRLGGLGELEQSFDLVRKRTRDLTACSTVPQ